ncbi:MAG: carbohydrate ABC transporter permease [Candidatus Brocadiales bacterium]|nr:carbohydrate ABC transporter permease [Candidatus Bathyanammoxibius amoris]
MKLWSNETLKISVFCAALGFIAAWSLGPYVWQLITSLTPSEELASLPPILPTRTDLSHYPAVFEEVPFARIILNSFVVASCTTVFCISIGSLTAYALAKLRFRGKIVVLGLVLAISMFPPISIVSPLYMIIRALGLRDTYAGLIFPYSTFALPLSIWIMTSFFREIPDDLVRAAKVDGCTPFQTLYKIIFPLAVPGIVTAAILVFIFSWNEFLFALSFTTSYAARTIPVGIALFPGVHEVPWGDIAAASIIVTVPLVILVVVFQGRIVTGITAGSVKE